VRDYEFNNENSSRVCRRMKPMKSNSDAKKEGGQYTKSLRRVPKRNSGETK
jgi:hypothetical protein